MPEPSDVVTIIARLRQHAGLDIRWDTPTALLCGEAANVIEALCAELAHHAGWRP